MTRTDMIAIHDRLCVAMNTTENEARWEWCRDRIAVLEMALFGMLDPDEVDDAEPYEPPVEVDDEEPN